MRCAYRCAEDGRACLTPRRCAADELSGRNASAVRAAEDCRPGPVSTATRERLKALRKSIAAVPVVVAR